MRSDKNWIALVFFWMFWPKLANFTGLYFGFAFTGMCIMMNLLLKDSETIVGLTVVSALVLTTVVLTIRTLLGRRVPVRQPARRREP